MSMNTCYIDRFSFTSSLVSVSRHVLLVAAYLVSANMIIGIHVAYVRSKVPD